MRLETIRIIFRYRHAVAQSGMDMELFYSRVFLPIRFEFPVIVELKVEGRLRLSGLKWDAFRR